MGFQILRSLSVGAGAGGGDWQLASGHYETAKISLAIIAPRPSLNTDSPYYRAYPGIQWRRPVVVLGGAWPFKYELLQAPSGMTIGETLDHNEFATDGLLGTNNSNYGVINWDNPTTSGSPHTVQVRVTDQEGTTATVTWTVTVTTSNYLFVDAATGNNSNAGTIGSPKLNLSGVYGATKGDATYDGYHVYLRAGTYAHDILPIEDTVRVTWTASKAHVLEAYPGESVTIANNGYYMNWEGGADISLIGIKFTARNSPGCKNLQFGSNSRILVDNCEFADQAGTCGGGSNTSSIFFAETGTYAQYIGIIRTRWTNQTTMAPVECYDTSHKVIEGCLVSGYSGGDGFYDKNDDINYTVRANRGLTSNSSFFAVIDTYSAQGPGEYCWNLWKLGSGNTHIQYGREAVSAIEIYTYRNTFISGSINFDDASGTVTHANNILQHDGTDADGITHSGGTEATFSGGATDLVGTSGIVNTTTGLLTGSFRTNNLGTDGFEVA